MSYKILISSSNIQNLNAVSYPNEGKDRPQFLEQAKQIFSQVKNLTAKQIQEYYNVSSNIALKIRNMHKNHGNVLYKAMELYNDSFYREIEISSFADWQWLNEHVLIVDPLYGLIKPYELIAPYRLEFTYKRLDRNLFKFWRQILQDELAQFTVYSLADSEVNRLLASAIYKDLGEGLKQKERGQKFNNILRLKHLPE